MTDWEKHTEWPRLMMWFGGRPDLVLIKLVHESGFWFMMDNNGDQ